MEINQEDGMDLKKLCRFQDDWALNIKSMSSRKKGERREGENRDGREEGRKGGRKWQMALFCEWRRAMALMKPEVTTLRWCSCGFTAGPYGWEEDIHKGLSQCRRCTKSHVKR